MDKKYYIRIAEELNISTEQVINTAALLDSGATVPFIARYRKELTGSLDEVVITDVRDRLKQLLDLDKRRDAILKSIEEQGKLTDELRGRILEVMTMAELEDLYLPYKPKKRTRATIAREKGLEPLAKIIMSRFEQDPYRRAKQYVNAQKGVADEEEALAGARDIIAEWISESQPARARVRKLFLRDGQIYSRIVKGKEIEGVNYRNYYEWNEPVSKIPSHRFLAMMRGEAEGFLKTDVYPPKEKAIETLEDIFIRNATDGCAEQIRKAVNDSYGRLLQPSMENEIKAAAKEKADKYAITVFADNLKQLLMQPPLGQKNVLAVDPGFRTGCKLVCLDKQGNLLHNETIYPHPPENQVKMAEKKILSLVDAYKIEAIAIGNGTAGRETERFIRNIRFDKDLIAVMVNESGASIYSASKIARDEFPDYDVTVRGAVSIGRRLMDPLAELVKIDPKSIGVGQYQHDVNQSDLQQSLEDTVTICVNQVGVEINTASKELLSYVSGVGPSLAQSIVNFRKENGPFNSRDQFRKVPRFGDKAFEQAAGFLRIRDAVNPLDRSAVHPESYHVVAEMAKRTGASVADLIQNDDIRKKINLNDYVSEKIGLPTLTDILQELAKPGRDPRQKFDMFEFAKGINSIDDLVPGMVLPGIITNITAFGAFVDIGVHQDGLVHVSQMANRFVRDPKEVVKINQKVMVKVLEVDKERKRINLTMKEI
ncbi:MAG TPA: Tex family protein [Bacteroidales bacterium]|nr:Tex family protein [Bacteroidales bacterium]HPM91905.1 Tex family protein [Bacteroidales bacterium]